MIIWSGYIASIFNAFLYQASSAFRKEDALQKPLAIISMVALHLGYFSPAIILFLALDYELDAVVGAEGQVHMDFCLVFKSEFWFYFLVILIFVQVLVSFVAILVLFYVMKKKLFEHCEGGFNQGLCGDRRKFYLSSMIQVNQG